MSCRHHEAPSNSEMASSKTHELFHPKTLRFHETLITLTVDLPDPLTDLDKTFGENKCLYSRYFNDYGLVELSLGPILYPGNLHYLTIDQFHLPLKAITGYFYNSRTNSILR